MNRKYYKRLIDRIFKILCMYENNEPTYNSYVKTICFELSGNKDYAEADEIRFKLYALILNESEQAEVRKTVFECINLIEKILNSSEV